MWTLLREVSLRHLRHAPLRTALVVFGIALGDRVNHGLTPLPGAVEMLRWVRDRGLPYLVFTNGTNRSPAHFAAVLREAGLSCLGRCSCSGPATFPGRRVATVLPLHLQGHDVAVASNSNHG